MFYSPLINYCDTADANNQATVKLVPVVYQLWNSKDVDQDAPNYGGGEFCNKFCQTNG